MPDTWSCPICDGPPAFPVEFDRTFTFDVNPYIRWTINDDHEPLICHRCPEDLGP